MTSAVLPPFRRAMRRMTQMLASDGMVVFMLTVVLVEATALLVYHRTTGAGPAPWELLTFLGAGGSLMVSMLFVRRVEQYPLHFAFALLAALGFHAAHVVLLWSR
ncbi:MAG: hypothetical protein P2975_01840 [Gemmatimonadota bacterium]|nr:hypothetical protein [Gemmatimonadota bacterium]MDQ8174453.1 hypothetical protein [Gemmatimonadota bacterium]